MLSIRPGYDVDYLTSAVAKDGENYYTKAVRHGEDPGRWRGAGAADLGLDGEVDAETMARVYQEFRDPRDPEQFLGRPRRPTVTVQPDGALPEDRERQTVTTAGKKEVPFFDATYSPPKSVSVLHAAFERAEIEARTAGRTDEAEHWAAYRMAVERAVLAGSDAALAYLEEKAGYVRTGHHGGAGGRWQDGQGFTVAQFLQRTNRDEAPFLHVHGAILNKVQGVDGKWRAVDGTALMRTHKQAASVVGDRAMFEELTATTGVQAATRPDGKAREIVGIDQATIDLFSPRTRVINPKTASLVDAFRARFGRDPNRLERWRLAQQATLATRRAKQHEAEPVEARLERFDRDLQAEVGESLRQVAERMVATAQTRPAGAFDENAVIEQALASVQAKHAAWNRANLAREVDAALPDHLGTDAAGVRDLIDGITDTALGRAVALQAPQPGDDTLPPELRLRNGLPAHYRPGAKLYATTDQLATETGLRDAADTRTAARLDPRLANLFLAHLGEQHIELTHSQRQAVHDVLTSGADVHSLVGPAGTGKSFTVEVIRRGWADPSLWRGEQHRVHALAVSQGATEVLAEEGLHARNVTRWLDTQRRLDEGRPVADDRDWELHANDLVVLDESGMVDTQDLAAIHGRVADRHARLLLTGDHRQLSSVGAAGGMDLIAGRGAVSELTETKRFVLPWEGDASLALRRGDLAGLLEYRKHGRIHDSGTIEQAEDEVTQSWLGDHLRGLDTIAVVDTNEQAARLSAKIRAERIRLGQVQGTGGVELQRDGNQAGPGDLVTARQNAWELAGWQGNDRPVLNRDRYVLRQVHDDGSVVVDVRDGGQLQLPARYVKDHLSLSYAQTVHAVEGTTVDTAHTIATQRTGRADFYVAMSRGEKANTAHVVTVPAREDMPTGEANKIPRQDPVVMLAGAFERDDEQLAALTVREESSAQARTLKAAQERFSAAADEAAMIRTRDDLDRLQRSGALTGEQRQRLATEEASPMLARELRRAEVGGHDPHRVLREAVDERELDSAESLSLVLIKRVQDRHNLTPRGQWFGDWVPATDNPAWDRHLRVLANEADGRFTNPVEATRELEDSTGDDLPAAPKPGDVERHAMWRAAWRASGRPEERTEEKELSTGLLRQRYKASQDELTWAPDYVAPELAGTHTAAARHREQAALRRAEGRHAEADSHDAVATGLAERAVALENADAARNRWVTHSAETRARGERARLELAHRGEDPEDHSRDVTAEQWLAAHRAEQREVEPHRRVLDESEVVRKVDHDDRSAGEAGGLETDVQSARETAGGTARAARGEGQWTRVPSADETAESVHRAHAALQEIHLRDQRDIAADRHHYETQTREWAVADAQEHSDAVADRIPSLADE